MLRRASEMRHYRIEALDGEIGRVEDWLFDDVAWTIRYLVADTGTFLPGRQVLVSPHAFRPLGPEDKRFGVTLHTADIENGPDITVDLPVSRRHEEALSSAFGWPTYWMDHVQPPAGPAPGVPVPVPTPADSVPDGDPHLRSAREVTGYAIEAADGPLGHVEDFVIETESWDIHYMMVDTRSWWIGGHVIVAPAWCRRIDWRNRRAYLDLTREALREAPEFDPAQLSGNQGEGR